MLLDLSQYTQCARADVVEKVPSVDTFGGESRRCSVLPAGRGCRLSTRTRPS